MHSTDVLCRGLWFLCASGRHSGTQVSLHHLADVPHGRAAQFALGDHQQEALVARTEEEWKSQVFRVQGLNSGDPGGP